MDYLNKLRKLCGYIENGSNETIRLFQDDATGTWFCVIGSDDHARRYMGRGLGQVIDLAFDMEKPE